MTERREHPRQYYFTDEELTVLRQQMRDMSDAAMRAQALMSTGPHPRLLAARAARDAAQASQGQE